MDEKELNKEQEGNLTDKEADIKTTDEMSEKEKTAEDAKSTENGETSGSEEPEATENTAEADETEDAAEPAVEKDPLELANEQIADLVDKYKRLAAEFDNYRKRTIKERAELILNGGEKVIKTLLPILDDMERATENGKKTDDVTVLREGMQLIFNKMMKTLEGHGVTVIDTENADFDTDLHEAVAMVPGMGDDKKGKVIDCLSKGYKLNDKVIRHAKVAVGQ